MGRALRFKLLNKAGATRFKDRRIHVKAAHGKGRKWRAVCARCIGTSHFESGAPCQDQTLVARFRNGVSVIALSDGAGSARYSHYGAFVAVKDAIRLLSEHFNEAFGGKEQAQCFARKLIKHIQRDLVELSEIGINLTDEERKKNGEPARDQALLVACSVRDLACTILAVAVRGDRFVSVHLGDGVIGMEKNRSGNTMLEVISGPENGEFTNETFFVTSGEAINKVRITTGRIKRGRETEITGFIIMSDGPEAALYDKKRSALAPACRKLFDANRSLKSEEMEIQLFRTLESVIARKTADDCSIAILAR